MNIRDAYRACYGKGSDYVRIPLTKDESAIIMDYAEKAAKLRHGKKGYKGTTLEKLEEAFFIGGCGETGSAKNLGHSIDELEFSVGGCAKDYAHADLKCIGINCGVKTSRYGLAPMVLQKELWRDGQCGDEIICTILEEDLERDKDGKILSCSGVIINGYATEWMLKKYQSRDFIYCKDNPKYADRAGFYGYEHLIPLKERMDKDIFRAFNAI